MKEEIYDGRSNNFALLHLSGVALVLSGHMYVLMGAAPPTVLGNQLHGLGVELLFLLSGFLVTQSLLRKKNLAEYYRNRIARIFPPLVFCLVLLLLAGWFLTEEQSIFYLQGAWTYFWHNLLMSPYFYVPGLFENLPVKSTLNGSLWSLPIEMMCYLLLPLVLLGSRNPHHKSNYVRFALLWALLMLCGWRVDHLGVDAPSLVIWGTNWVNAFRLIAFFASGSFVSHLLFFHSEFKKYLRPEFAVLLVVICEIGGMGFSPMRYVVLPYTALSVALAPPMRSAFFNRHEYTYGLYLFAYPVQQSLLWVFEKQRGSFPPVWIMLLLAFTITLLMAAITSELVEKPIGRFIKKHPFPAHDHSASTN
ncbi:MAG: acyltransferase [Intestinimonas sp.]|jgi:peptidoglycan/LPS O-acetylase OafA/YrhL|nr:acyltransferase [Intestinimonas sp.]